MSEDNELASPDSGAVDDNVHQLVPKARVPAANDDPEADGDASEVDEDADAEASDDDASGTDGDDSDEAASDDRDATPERRLVAQTSQIKAALDQHVSAMQELAALIQQGPDPADPHGEIRDVMRRERLREMQGQHQAATVQMQRLVHQTAVSKFNSAERGLAAKVEALPVLSVETFQLMVQSDHGAALARHLVKNPSVAERLAGLSPYQQAYEIAKLEMKLSQLPSKKAVPQAGAPPARLKASGGGVSKDPSKMTEAEYAEYYSRRQKAKARGTK